MPSWYTGKDESGDEIETIAAIWPGALDLDPEALAIYLDAARAQCEAYARDRNETEIPARYQLAQVLQARALARAGAIGTDGELQAGVESITIFPMDWTVKRLLNPEKRIGGIA